MRQQKYLNLIKYIIFYTKKFLVKVYKNNFNQKLTKNNMNRYNQC